MSIDIESKKNKIGRFTLKELDDIDILSLLDYESIVFYNEVIDNDGISYKDDDNISYLNNTFRICKELRDMGYKGLIQVQIDSLYDVGNSLFNYDFGDLRVAFSSSLYNIEAVNSFINYYIYSNKDISIDNMSMRDIIIKILFSQIKELYTYMEQRSTFRKEISDSIYRYINFDFVYDLGKIFGLSFIRYSDDEGDILYYFDHNSDKVKKLYTYELLDDVLSYFDLLDYEGNDKGLLKEVSSTVDEIIKNDDMGEIDRCTIYDDYLNCNSIEEFDEIIRHVEDLNKHYNYLLSILMDLSIDDYKEYKKNEDTSNIRVALRSVFELILSKKKELTKRKIVMTYYN